MHQLVGLYPENTVAYFGQAVEVAETKERYGRYIEQHQDPGYDDDSFIHFKVFAFR